MNPVIPTMDRRLHAIPPGTPPEMIDAHEKAWTAMVSQAYGVAIILSGFVFFGMVAHAYELLRQFRPRWGIAMTRVPGFSRLVALYRSTLYYTIPNIGPFSFPCMRDTVLIVAFIGGILGWTFGIPHYYTGFGSPPIALRAGMMAMGTIPFLYAMAFKINPISFLTGLSHAELQVFHQSVAVIFCFLSFIHGAGMLRGSILDHGMDGMGELYKKEHLWWDGTAALVVLVWIIISGLGFFRRFSYRFFVVNHICMVIAFTGLMFNHVEQIQGSHIYLWAATACWIFSIVVRSCLLLYSSEYFGGPRARVQMQMQITSDEKLGLLSDDHNTHVLRMSFQTPLRWRPGQHIYVRFPTINILQAHPFSPCSLPNTNPLLPSELVIMSRVHNGVTGKIFDHIKSLEDNYELAYAQSSLVQGTCRNTTSDEKRWWESANMEKEKTTEASSRSSDTCIERRPGSNQASNEKGYFEGDNPGLIAVKSTRILALLDGPYGHIPDVATVEHSVLFAGGSGVTHIFPIMLGVLHRVAAGEKSALTKSIRLLWSTRSLEMMNWVRAELQNVKELEDVTGIKVSVEVFVTRNANELVRSSEKIAVTCNARFDTKSVLAEEVEYAKEMGSTTMGIHACGSGDLMVAVSNEVARLNYDVLRGRLGTIKDIALKTERFIM